MEGRYIASMVLSGVGDAMGYKCGEWEFCFDGEKIHKEMQKLGGVEKIKICKPKFIVSDDTVLLLATAEGLIAKSSTNNMAELYAEVAFHYKQDFVNDMKDRAGGLTTGCSCHALRPFEENGWQIPFNPRGGGCGAAMRSMCIGLRYPNIYEKTCLEKLIEVSVETGRMTHNHPTGYLGSFASALFASLAVNSVPLTKWGHILCSLLPRVLVYIQKVGRDVSKNEKAWSYFEERWREYLVKRNILDGMSKPSFPETYGIKERDAFYKSCSYSGWGGSSGHDAPMIAYDALLFAQNNWVKLCHHGMLHSGDNDSTGIISGFCYGAMYGLDSVPKNNHKNVEYVKRLSDAGAKLYTLAMNDGYLKSANNDTNLRELPMHDLFND